MPHWNPPPQPVHAIVPAVGGGVALTSHGTKAVTRLAANTSPEPFSNIALSFMEDFIAVGSSVLMVFHPVVILVVVIVFVCFAAWLTPKIVRFLRNLFRTPPFGAKVDAASVEAAS